MGIFSEAFRKHGCTFRKQSYTEVIMNNLDISAIENQISEMENESYHEDNVYKQTDEHSLLEKMYRGTQKYCNQGDYKEPAKK